MSNDKKEEFDMNEAIDKVFKDSKGYCSCAIVPRGVSAHFVRKSRVFQREIASFCDFCASRSVLLVTE